MVQTRHAALNEATVLRQDRQDSLALRNTTSTAESDCKSGSPMARTVCIPHQWCVPEGTSRALYLNKIPRKTPGHRRAPLLYT